MLAWRVHLICTVLFLALLLWGSLSGAPATDFVAPSHLPPQPLCPWATTPDSEKTFFGYMEEYAEVGWGAPFSHSVLYMIPFPPAIRPTGTSHAALFACVFFVVGWEESPVDGASFN